MSEASATPGRSEGALKKTAFWAIASIAGGILSKFWEGLPESLTTILLLFGCIFTAFWGALRLTDDHYSARIAALQARIENAQASPVELSQMLKKRQRDENWSMVLGLVVGFIAYSVICAVLEVENIVFFIIAVIVDPMSALSL